MPSFQKIAKLAPNPRRTATMRLHLPGFDKPFQLTGVTATEENKAFYRLSLAQINANKSAAKRGVTPELMKQRRTETIVSYAKHVITGWADVVDDDGAPVPFSEKNVIELFEQLPVEYFDEVREFFGDAANFRDVELPTAADIGPNS